MQKKKNAKENTFISRSELADQLGISRKTLYNWLKKEGIQLKKGRISPLNKKIILNKINAS